MQIANKSSREKEESCFRCSLRANKSIEKHPRWSHFIHLAGSTTSTRTNLFHFEAFNPRDIFIRH